MNKFLFILILSVFASCTQTDTHKKESFVMPIFNYYQLQTKDIKSVDEVRIDSVVAITEKGKLENAIAARQKKYYFFVEAKDDEYADSAARDIERMNQKLKTAENSTVLYYTVYHTVIFTGNDQVRRKRQSYFDINLDYQIQQNPVTEMDKLEGIKGEEMYKPYTY